MPILQTRSFCPDTKSSSQCINLIDNIILDVILTSYNDVLWRESIDMEFK